MSGIWVNFPDYVNLSDLVNKVVNITFIGAASAPAKDNLTENARLMQDGLDEVMRQMLISGYDMHPSRVDEYWRQNVAYQGNPAGNHKPDPMDFSEPLSGDVGVSAVSVLSVRGAGGS